MSLAIQCLLRLPGCLRSQAFLETIPQRHLPSRRDIPNGIARRAFSNTSQVLKQPRFSKPPSPATGLRTPPPPARTSSSPPARGTAPSPAARTAPPPQAHTPSKPKSYAESLLDSSHETLLYKAPNHRSFAIVSYIAGGALILGAYNWAILGLSPPPNQDQDQGSSSKNQSIKTWILTSTTMFTTIFMAVAGTTLFLAPAKLVGKVSATTSSVSGRTMLKCEMKNPLPFMRTKVIEVPPSQALMDRRVSAQDIDFTSIPLSKSRDFTMNPARYAQPSAQRRNVMMRAWDALRRDTRRMFLRDGFAYVRFTEHGNWKMDLQGCELLDHGRALERMTTPDEQRGIGVIALFRRKYLA